MRATAAALFQLLLLLLKKGVRKIPNRLKKTTDLWMFSINLKLPPLVWILLTEPGAILLINLHKTMPSRNTSSYGWWGNFSPKTASIQSTISCSCSLLRPCKKTKTRWILDYDLFTVHITHRFSNQLTYHHDCNVALQLQESLSESGKRLERSAATRTRHNDYCPLCSRVKLGRCRLERALDGRHLHRNGRISFLYVENVVLPFFLFGILLQQENIW